MDKQRLLQLIATVVPHGAREMVPHAIKEPIVRLFSTEKPPPPPHFLEVPQVPRASFDVAWRAVGDYMRPFEAHRERHFELCNAIAYFFPDWKADIDVLTIDGAAIAPLCQRLFPRMRLTSLDGTTAGGGADPAACYDLVLCADTNGLQQEPADFLTQQIGRLKPHGLLHLTTPNGPGARAAGASRMAQLHSLAEASGGRIIASYFSACFDAVTPLRREERSTLVIVVAHKLQG